jgi:hypothetical protein
VAVQRNIQDNASGGTRTGSENWHQRLLVLQNGTGSVRALTAADAPSLLAHPGQPVVVRYLAAAPTAVEGFRRFIRWTHIHRRMWSLLADEWRATHPRLREIQL